MPRGPKGEKRRADVIGETGHPARMKIQRKSPVHLTLTQAGATLFASINFIAPFS
jgi:hypothetical protein